MTAPDSTVLDARATAKALPYAALADEIEALLREDGVAVPPRIVLPLAKGATLFAMPAADRRTAITKLITLTPGNVERGEPLILGDIVVFEVATGRRVALLDGPTVTARRTAAVSLVAARRLAAKREGPLLIVGAGVQGRAHLEAFHEGLGLEEVWIASRRRDSAQALARHAQSRGVRARVVDDANAALAECPWVVSATPAREVVLHTRPRADAFVAAVGAFTPTMQEWAPEVCMRLAREDRVLVDTRDADHEAGDLLQAGIDVSALPTLQDLVRHTAAWQAMAARSGPVFFKSCGWGGWDLAAARCALRPLASGG